MCEPDPSPSLALYVGVDLAYSPHMSSRIHSPVKTLSDIVGQGIRTTTAFSVKLVLHVSRLHLSSISIPNRAAAMPSFLLAVKG